MIQTTIEQTDPQGRAITVPADVLAAIEPAQKYLLERLRAAEHLPVQIKWHRFENRGSDGWAVDLHLDYDGWGFGQQLRVEQLRQPRPMRDAVREVVWKFGDVLNDWVSDRLRRVRALATVAGDGEE